MGTFLPIFLFPEQVFTTSPLSLSLVGQYILKNLVIIGALFVLYAKSVKKQGRVVYIRSFPEQAGMSYYAHEKQDKGQSLLLRSRKAGIR